MKCSKCTLTSFPRGYRHCLWGQMMGPQRLLSYFTFMRIWATQSPSFSFLISGSGVNSEMMLCTKYAGIVRSDGECLDKIETDSGQGWFIEENHLHNNIFWNWFTALLCPSLSSPRKLQDGICTVLRALPPATLCQVFEGRTVTGHVLFDFIIGICIGLDSEKPLIKN